MAFFGKETHSTSKKTQLCDTLALFYDEEISKIGERKLWFEDIRKYWEAK